MNQNFKKLQNRISSFCKDRDWDQFHSPKNLAHIIPYKGSSTNHIQNGILLRADIHTLFDLDLLRIDENYLIHIDKSIDDIEYRKFDGKYLRLPSDVEFYPSKDALKKRFEQMIR